MATPGYKRPILKTEPRKKGWADSSLRLLIISIHTPSPLEALTKLLRVFAHARLYVWDMPLAYTQVQALGPPHGPRFRCACPIMCACRA